jgi:hypothetical protein
VPETDTIEIPPGWTDDVGSAARIAGIVEDGVAEQDDVRYGDRFYLLRQNGDIPVADGSSE